MIQQADLMVALVAQRLRPDRSAISDQRSAISDQRSAIGVWDGRYGPNWSGHLQT
jgi:hypothetical protein